MIALLLAQLLLDGTPSEPMARFWVQGDTQTMAAGISGSTPQAWIEQNEWVCKMRPEAVLHTGDIVHNVTGLTDWNNANAAFDVLDACELRYITPAGNHDYLHDGNPDNPPSWHHYDFFMTTRDQTRVGKHFRVDTHTDGHAWLEHLWEDYYIIVLPFTATPAEESWTLQAARALPQGAKLILLQHWSAWRGGPANPPVRQYIASAERAGIQLVAVIGGHARGIPRTAYLGWPTSDPDLFNLYSNFQDYETGYTGGVFDKWGSWLEIYKATGQLCARSASVDDRYDLFGGRVCWTP